MSSPSTQQAESPETSEEIFSRETWFRIGAVAVGFVAAVALLEISLWVLGIEPSVELTKRNLRYFGENNESVGFHCYSTNPDEEFQPLPNLMEGTWQLYSYSLPPEQLPLEAVEDTPWCVGYPRNSMGFRDVEHSPQPPEDVTRIAVVGDSFVFGEGVQFDGTLPVQINQALGPRYEVLNMGEVGASTQHELALAYQAVEHLNVHRMIFVFLLNDVEQTETLASQQEYINDLIIFRDAHLSKRNEGAWYKGHLRLLDFVGSRLQMSSIEDDTIQWYRDCYDPSKNSINLLQLEASFHELSILPDCRVAMVIYPLMEGFQDGYPFAEIHEMVRQLAENAGLPVLDLAPSFEGLKASGLWVHPSDHHPNRRAQGIAAKAIVSWLRRDLPDFLNADAAGDSSDEVEDTALDEEIAELQQNDLEQGAALVQQGQLFDARLRFVRVLKRDPQNEIAHLYLGIIADNEGKLAEAIVHYREALRLRPGWADAANNLASTLVTLPVNTLHDASEPVRLAEAACEATEYMSIRHLDTLLAAYGQAGMYEKAVETALWTLDLEGIDQDPAVAEQIRAKLAHYRQLLAENPPEEEELEIVEESAEDTLDSEPMPEESEPGSSAEESSANKTSEPEAGSDENTEASEDESSEPSAPDTGTETESAAETP